MGIHEEMEHHRPGFIMCSVPEISIKGKEVQARAVLLNTQLKKLCVDLGKQVGEWQISWQSIRGLFLGPGRRPRGRESRRNGRQKREPAKEEAVYNPQPAGLTREVPPPPATPPAREPPWSNQGVLNYLESNAVNPPQTLEMSDGQMHRIACGNEPPQPVFQPPQPYQPSYWPFPHSSPNAGADLFHVVGNLRPGNLVLGDFNGHISELDGYTDANGSLLMQLAERLQLDIANLDPRREGNQQRREAGTYEEYVVTLRSIIRWHMTRSKNPARHSRKQWWDNEVAQAWQARREANRAHRRAVKAEDPELEGPPMQRR
ncbi:hypothetical protein HPB52_005000 [Rhipicephalus sanguineus]|uniref:Endonuclease/exonuclease/phosphatase domain-containing protein n=1 Tax=Rhipicephalus sanguineus TaxID=34632 RepID=A0A9D4T6X3_RHISA|nr:hypothetical protein HPB52_005000 [Rhipicephalus sanguineus]